MNKPKICTYLYRLAIRIIQVYSKVEFTLLREMARKERIKGPGGFIELILSNRVRSSKPQFNSLVVRRIS